MFGAKRKEMMCVGRVGAALLQTYQGEEQGSGRHHWGFVVAVPITRQEGKRMKLIPTSQSGMMGYVVFLSEARNI